jgi:hypothetical protein
MDTKLIVEGTCRRCHAPVSIEIQKLPVISGMAECSNCHYWTMLRDDPFLLPLEETLQQYLKQDEIDTILDGFKDPDLVSQRAIDALLKIAIVQVDENRTVAVAGLLQLMHDLDNIQSKYFKSPSYGEKSETHTAFDMVTKNSVSQLLYWLLSIKEPVVIPKEEIEASVITKVVGYQIFPLLSNIVTLSKMMRPAIYEKSTEFVFKDKQLFARKLKKHDLMMEGKMNMQVQEKRDLLQNPQAKRNSLIEVILSDPSYKALALTTGVNIDDLVHILQNRMEEVVSQGVASRDGNLVIIADQYLQDEYRVMFKKLSNTLEKLHRFRSPCFFDIGPTRSTNEASLELIAEASAMNWSAYYPCFEMKSPVNGSTLYVTTPTQLQAMLMTMNQCEAFILNQLEETYGKKLPEPQRKELRSLIHQTHHDLEVEAGQKFSEAGWQCITGVEKINGKAPACGEIDLIATAVVNDVRIVLVGEVKNCDMAMFKPGFDERTKNLIAHAEKQLTRKGDWISDHWDLVVDLLRKPGDQENGIKRKYLAKLVITPRPVAAHVFLKYTGRSIGGLRSLSTEMLQGDPGARKDDWKIKLQEVKKI